MHEPDVDEWLQQQIYGTDDDVILSPCHIAISEEARKLLETVAEGLATESTIQELEYRSLILFSAERRDGGIRLGQKFFSYFLLKCDVF